MRIDWQNVQVQLKFAGKYLAQKGVAVDPTWKFWMFDQTLWFVWSGRARIDLPKGKTPLNPGTCLWLRPGFHYRQRQEPSRPLGVYVIHFDLLMPDGRLRPPDAPLPPELLTPPNPNYVGMIMERLTGANPESVIWSSAMTPLARKQATHLLTALLMELDATATAEPSAPRREPPLIARINNIARKIRENPAQFNSVDDMAREAQCATAYFSRRFREIWATSPHDALIISRIRHAAYMLLETELPIKAIAEKLRYCDTSSFTYQFRKFMGVSPARYRKNPPHPPAHKTGVPLEPERP